MKRVYVLQGGGEVGFAPVTVYATKAEAVAAAGTIINKLGSKCGPLEMESKPKGNPPIYTVASAEPRKAGISPITLTAHSL